MERIRSFEDKEWVRLLAGILSVKEEQMHICYFELPIGSGRTVIQETIRVGYSTGAVWKDAEALLKKDNGKSVEKSMQMLAKSRNWISTEWIELEAKMGGMAKRYRVMIAAMVNGDAAQYAKVLECVIAEIAHELKNTRELECIGQLKNREGYLFRELENKWTLMEKYACYTLKKEHLPEAELLIELSAARYEGSDSEARIYFTRDKIDTVEYFAEIGKDVRIIKTSNMRMIRKLMEISKRKTVYLYAERENKEHVISCLVVPKRKAMETDLYIKFSGFMHWSVMMGEREELTYYHGRYYVNFSQENNEYLDEIDRLENVNRDMLKELVAVVRKQTHGTSVVLVNEEDDMAQTEVDRLCKLNRGIRVASLIQYKKERADKNGWNEEQILSVTGIDGALFMDFRGHCLAMGVIVDGEAKIEGNAERGARFNSIANYIMQKHVGEYIGIIVSEDGMINIISNKKKK